MASEQKSPTPQSRRDVSCNLMNDCEKMDENIYHQIQYDRIDNLETRRENFSNYVLTICTGVLGITLANPNSLDSISIFFIFLFGFAINMI